MRIGKNRAVSKAAVPRRLLMEHHLPRPGRDLASIEAALRNWDHAPDVEHDESPILVGWVDIGHIQIRLDQELPEAEHSHASCWNECIDNRNRNHAAAVASIGRIRI